jgi:hypothetical protein
MTAGDGEAGIGVATSTGDSVYAFWAGNTNSANAEFSVKHDGTIKGTKGEIGGWTLAADGLHSDSHHLQITGSTGQITGSEVLFTGGKIGAFNMSTTGLHSDSNEFQVTGSSGQITGSAVQFTSGKIADWNFDTEKLYKQHASDVRRIELDTNATVVDSTNHTAVQAISMTSGSNYNAMVQMSNIEQFINETDAYTTGEDYILVTYDDLVTELDFHPSSATTYQLHSATLVGESAAGGGGEQD